MGLLPTNYNVPESGSGDLYAKLEKGENRFRLIDSVTTGWIVWEDKKPTRYKDKSDLPAGSEAKHFWFVPVWMNDSVKFLEMSQMTVIRELAFLNEADDWGDLSEYDVIVRRTGENMETKYHVSPCPKKALPKAAKDAWEEMQSHYKPENLFIEDGVVFLSGTKDEDEELPF